MTRYLSVCSGIEAASAAWHPLGWEPLAFSEIEDFPRAVLRHRFPGVPLHGDFTRLRDEPWIVDADLLVGGTPCQAFSVAGLRRSLDDDRGNLTIEFVRLADAIDDLRRDAGREPAWVVWENVPGVLSVADNAFGAFLAGLVGHDAPIEPPPGLGWTYAGVVSGPRRVAAWRVLDAQYAGVAQRRRRVFLLALGGSGGWACADALLPVAESLRGHPPPRREAGKGTAHGLTARAGNSSRPAGSNGNLIPDIAPTLDATMDRKWGSNQWVDSGFGIVEPVVMSSGQANAEIRTDGGAPYLTCLHEAPIIAHALTGNGFDASKDGTGRGTPIVPVHAFDARQSDVIQYGDMAGPLDTDGHSVAVVTPVMGAGHGGSNGAGIGAAGDPAFTLDTCGAQAVAFDTTQITSAQNRSNPQPGDPCHPLAAGAHAPAVAFSGDTHASTPEADSAEVLRTLRKAVGAEAFAKWGSGILDPLQSPEILRAWLHGGSIRRAPREAGRVMDDRALACAKSVPAGPLRALWKDGPDGRSPQGRELAQQLARELGTSLPKLPPVGASATAVRRLTPKEAERLQGFPDGWTDIPYRGKPAADGARYKALGNSMAVPCMAYLGERIAAVTGGGP